MITNNKNDRELIPNKYKWKLTDIFKSESEWRKNVDSLKSELQKLEKFKGTLTKSSLNLLNALKLETKLSKEASRISLYAGLNSDLDTRNMKYSGIKQELEQIFSNFAAKTAFMEPEILSSEQGTIESFITEEPGLGIYRMKLIDMFRTKAHTLSEPEERIMAMTNMITSIPESIYGTFSNAEMPKPEVTLSDGKTIALGSAEYSKYRSSVNREDRKKVFKTYWNNFEKFKASYGEMLYGNVKTDIFNFRAKHYKSSLESSLYPVNIPTEVYHSLINNVNKELPAFHRYLKIRKRMLGIDTLEYYDLYAPVVKGIDLQYTYDEAVKIVINALKPLGDDYLKTVEKAISEQWIDVFPTEGKRSGGYSNGAFYEGHPYILLNYTNLYNDVSTLAHELGHTMQSYYSNKMQPYPLADYTIFVAEVASTFNEVLLFNYVIKTVKDDDVRLSILMNWLDCFKGTLFRQTQFAEFELEIHEEAEKGNPLTGDDFSRIYSTIVRKYYGEDKNICHIDDYINTEWAFIPHFYYNFYVYQYSTSFTASVSLAEKVMSGDKDALKNYLNFLSAGCSDYPIKLLKKAGVDMKTEEPFKKTIEAMNKIMDEIEKILDKKERSK